MIPNRLAKSMRGTKHSASMGVWGGPTEMLEELNERAVSEGKSKVCES